MRCFAILAVASLIVAPAMAETETFGPECVTFTSDLSPNQSIFLPQFDTNGGLHVLDSVSISLTHSGSADIAGDNDDALNTAEVQARIIRAFDVSGVTDPGFIGSGSETVQSNPVVLGLENGDGGDFDSTGPDGHYFGVLSYSDQVAPAIIGDMNNYIGNGSVEFDVDATTMVNDLNFVGDPPDVWQLEVQNPVFEICMSVTYEYTVIPEPASLALMALGLLIRRR